MKRLLLACFILIFNYSFSQQAGDIYEIEQKLDLTPSGVAELIAESQGEEVTPELHSFLNSFEIGLLAYKLTYYTTDYDDNLVKATGLVMWPKTSKKMSTVLYCHPTTDRKENVPSNLKDILQVGFVLPLTYALSEYVVIAPDYYGYGDGEGEPNYTDAKTTAASIIDMYTAATTFLDDMNLDRFDQNFMTGYSLGGHAGMATLKKTAEDNSIDFDFAYLGAGPHDMSQSMLQEGVIEVDTFPFSSFLSYVIYTADNLGYDLNNGDWRNVISDEYYDAFYQANVEQQFGLFWGPKEWRKLFTDEFITAVENDDNHPLRQYTRDNNVYDWYNRTPTTMSGGWLDKTIPDDNNWVARGVQRGYYPWWDWNKYNINAVDMGFYNHITGIVPWLLASVYEFNTRRYGGFFNTYAYRSTSDSEIDLIYQRSSVLNQVKSDGEVLQTLTVDSSEKAKKQGSQIFIESFQLQNGEVKKYPVVMEQAIEVEQEELLNKVGKETVAINLHGLEEDILAVNVFRNNALVKEFQGKEVRKMNQIHTADLQNNDLIEVVTENLIFTTRFKTDNKVNVGETDITVYQQGNTVTVYNKKTDFQIVEVVNQAGQTVLTNAEVTNQYNLELKRGMYFLRLTDVNQKQYLEKVVVM